MKTLLSFIIMLISFSVVAQKSDSTHTHYRIIRGGMIEHSTELKSKPHIKNGSSEIKSGKNLLATGIYKDGERFGRWRFFKELDSIEQVYNYTTKKLEYNNPDKDIIYEVDSLKPGDKIVYPAKIGGFATGLHFLIKKFSPPKEFKQLPGEHPIFLIFYIDEHGKLTKYETETGGGELKKKYSIDLKELQAEDFEFVPAYVNGKSVASRLIFKSRLTVD
nr:hypothetical protein [Pedobacter sp. ASV2]